MKIKAAAGDLTVYAVVTLLALLSLAALRLPADTAAANVRITANGTEAVYPLSVPRTLQVTGAGHTLTVCIAEGTVSVTDSDCPDRVCVHTGAVSAAGQVIACVPAGILIEITGGNADADIIIG